MRLFPRPSTRLFFALLGVTLLLAASAHSQTFQVVHAFTGGADGAHPQAGIAIDAAGNLYAATTGGGNQGGNCSSFGCGAILRLSHHDTNWTATPFYIFQGGSDGALPDANVVIGRNGTLYGTTSAGGDRNGGFGYGTVFSLQPPLRACANAPCSWTESVLYRFTGDGDGREPTLGPLVIDSVGNMYGTTEIGGGPGCDGYGCGTVFKLSPSIGGGWTETVLYRFNGGSDGAYPQGGLAFDVAGNIYGTTSVGGVGTCDAYIGGCGVVFKLSPSENGWAQTVLYSFTGGSDGNDPEGGLIFGAPGTLYGTTASGGDGNGTVFQLTANGEAWGLNTIYAFPGEGVSGPTSSLMLDSHGDLYGTTLAGPPNQPPCQGSIFRLSRDGGNWNYSLLHCFTGDNDGAQPYSSITPDGHGNLFGTTFAGGQFGDGVVWELTP